MPHGKKTPITNANVKLLPLAKLSALIALTIKTVQSGRALIDQSLIQCMLHAQKHGDVMPGARLLEGLRGSGVVVAAAHKWFSDHSPIEYKFDKEANDGKGGVVGRIAKEGEPGYKPWNTGAAEEAPALSTVEAKDRAERKITPFSIGYMSNRIKSFRKELDKAVQDGREIVGNTDVIRAYIEVIEKADLGYRAKIVKPVVNNNNEKPADQPKVTRSRRQQQVAKAA